MPIDIVISAVFAALAYLIVGLSTENSEQILYYILIITVVVIYAKGLGIALVIGIADPQASAAMGPFLAVIQMLFAGLLINFDDIPDYLIPIHYTSVFKYSWSAAMQNEFDTWD